MIDQENKPTPIVVDIGNSWIKFASFDPAQPDGWLYRDRVRWSDEFTIPIRSESCHWFVASVSRPGLERFLQFVEQGRPNDRVTVIKYTDFEFPTQVDFPDKTGIDRFCAVAGALELVQSDPAIGLPAIIADIGTAVTVDALDVEGTFLGGTIFIGPVKALQELSEQTDALPDVSEFDLASSVHSIGKNTRDALKAGALLSLVGGIKEIAERQSSHLGQPATVLITGGGAPYVRPLVPESWKIVEDLVLRGIRAAAISKSGQNPSANSIHPDS